MTIFHRSQKMFIFRNFRIKILSAQDSSRRQLFPFNQPNHFIFYHHLQSPSLRAYIKFLGWMVGWLVGWLIVVERLWRSNSAILINRNTLSHHACTTMALLLTYCWVIIQTVIALSKIGKENILLGNGNDRQRQMQIIL